MDYVIIVAGGKGLRMGSDVPKQFLPLGGVPVLMRTISRFAGAMPRAGIILVLPESQHDYWDSLCRHHSFDVEHTVTAGGDTRFASSRNGLLAIPADADGLVGIHDGVRPFVSEEVIHRCYAAARDLNMIPAESAEAIHLVAMDTRPLSAASTSAQTTAVSGEGTQQASGYVAAAAAN